MAGRCGPIATGPTGRDSKCLQRGGFASPDTARTALERAVQRAERRRLHWRSLTLSELADEYLAQHDAQPETTAKLRWLLSKSISVFGTRPIVDLQAREIARWRMALPAGHRFEATQALRQVLARAIAWGLLEANPAKVGVDNPPPKRREMLPLMTYRAPNCREHSETGHPKRRRRHSSHLTGASA